MQLIANIGRNFIDFSTKSLIFYLNFLVNTTHQSCVYLKMNRIEKLQEYLKAQPEDPFLQHALALEYSKAGDSELAVAIFIRLLQQHPQYVGSYYHLAALLVQQKKIGEAIEWYEKGMAAAKQAGDTHALNELRAAYDDVIDV
jgi:tetratricopeptide (TPR) repeat protein